MNVSDGVNFLSSVRRNALLPAAAMALDANALEIRLGQPLPSHTYSQTGPTSQLALRKYDRGRRGQILATSQLHITYQLDNATVRSAAPSKPQLGNVGLAFFTQSHG